MSPILLAVLLPVLGDTTTFEVAGGAEATARGGLMAVTPRDPSRLAADAAITLLSGVRARGESSNFTLVYRPRYYYQVPNVADTKLPLFLHQLRASYTDALTRKTTLNWSAQGSVGALSYSSLLQLFPAGTAAAATGFIPLATGNTSASVRHAFSRAALTSLEVNAAYSSLIGSNHDDVAIPTSFNVGGRLSQTWKLDRRNTLGADAGANYVIRDPNSTGNNSEVALASQNWLGSFGISWQHTLAAQSTLGVTAGVGLSAFDGLVPRSAFPTFSLSYTDQHRALGATWNWTAAAGARGYFDPLLTTFRPQGFANLTLDGRHGRHTRSQLTGLFWTTLSEEPIVPSQFETTGQARLTLRQQFTPQLSGNVGGEWYLRAGHLSQTQTPLVQHQFIAFIGLRYTLGADSSQGSWL